MTRLFRPLSITVKSYVRFYSNQLAMQSRVFKYARRFEGLPKITDFELKTEELKALEENEILCEGRFWSVDPYMRVYVERHPLGITMIGGQVAKVIESKHPKYPLNSWIFAYFGWSTHNIINPDKAPEEAQFRSLPELGTLSPSLALGNLGMPGNTAYFGLLELCHPKPDETVVVSGAAGAVGSAVGQIAKIKGCRVVGIAGGPEKCSWLTKEMGFDAAIDYKSQDVRKALKETAPKGVDCYFDNVGGEISSAVIRHMNLHGRIAVCGAISSYNDDVKNWPKVPHLQPEFVFKQLKMEGFIVTRWLHRWMEGILQIKQWMKEGKIKSPETFTDGFENLPQALIEMLQGKNVGKAIVRAKI
ncbi:prostaglandin reductase 1-like [Lutzomyia longipalpis]|uniref:prostaglandin reductase 1-like n=1 Tax=Lutzomyia longipalpis TaxID=7200 RepID=UPI0024843F00|nr:prostaglandin reductase 1-like [Lutzomyia longipalpis]XP_055693548.1 prostaglandin reductase 1-like [Lutzomyia longipalpis]